MPNYSANFAKFQQSLATQSQDDLRPVIQAMSDFGRIRAAQKQQELRQRADLRSMVMEDVTDFDGSDMWEWQAASTRKQIMATGQMLLNDEIDSLQYSTMISNIDANVSRQKANYRAEVGNPETAEATDSTYYGQLKAIDEWVTKGVNVHEDNHVIIKGLNGGDDGVMETQQALQDRFVVRNGGKSPNAQVIDSFYKGTEWTYLVGDPNNPDQATEISAKDYLNNNEGKNAFLLPFENLTRIMSDYAVEDRVENFIQDGGKREMEQWFNQELMTNKAFRKDVFSQFGTTLFGSNQRDVEGMFSSMEGLGMSYDSENNKIVFEPGRADTIGVEKMIDNARSNFVKEYAVRHQAKKTPRSEMMGDDKIIPISFEHDKAYDQIVMALTSTDVTASPYSRIPEEQFKNIGPLIGMAKGIQMGETQDVLEGAVRVNIGNSELDGKLIGKFVKEETVMVPDPSIPAEQMAILRAQNAVTMVEQKVKMPYYRELNDEQIDAFYRAIGVSLNAPRGEAAREGAKYVYNKSVNR